MKTISKNFTLGGQPLIDLLRASINNETFIYKGAECTVAVTPKITEETIKKINPDKYSACCDSSSESDSSVKYTNGFFKQKGFSMKLVTQRSSMHISLKNRESMRLEVQIKSKAFKALETAELENIPKAKKQEWLEKNADKVETTTCVIL